MFASRFLLQRQIRCCYCLNASRTLSVATVLFRLIRPGKVRIVKIRRFVADLLCERIDSIRFTTYPVVCIWYLCLRAES